VLQILIIIFGICRPLPYPIVDNASQLANIGVSLNDSDSYSRLTTGVQSAYELGSTEKEAEAKLHDIETSVNESRLSHDWEHVEGEFTLRGGELFHWASDNSLCIVPGAIPVGETWRIRGQMHTLLDQFDEYLSQCSNYNAFFSNNFRQYCSSVFEIRIISASDAQDRSNLLSRCKEFNQPVSITIRHVAMGISRQDLRVFCLHDNKVIQEIKTADTNDESSVAPYYLLDDDYVTIKTTHFSYYFVCVCSEQPINTDINFINAIVYGRIYPERDGEYTHKAHVDFGLQFIPSLTTLPDFWQVGEKLFSILFYL
jgi:hypothetical protein